MRAWLLEVVDVVGGLAFAISVLLFLIGLLIRFTKKDPDTSTTKEILKLLESSETQDDVGLTVYMNDSRVFLNDIPVQVKLLYFQLEEKHEIAVRQFERIKEAYLYMAWSAGAGILAFMIFRLIHFV